MGRLRQQQHGQHLSVLFALTLLASGCGNKIRGEIEDQQIKPKSVFFFAQEAVLGTDSLIGVVITDQPSGCEKYSAFLGAAATSAIPADMASQWAANFPEPDWWDVTFLIRTAAVSTPLTGQVFTGIKWNESLDAVGKASGGFTHNLAVRDTAYWDGTGDYNAYRKDYVSNGGSLEISNHVPGDKIAGRFATFTVDPLTGGPTGLLEISFNGSFCPAADLLDNAGQTQPAAR